MLRPPRWLRSRPVIAAGIGLAVGLAVIAVRQLGALEAVELDQYDRYLRSRTAKSVEASPVVLVRIYESDIRDYGHPLSDGLLTLILDTLLNAEPRAIGVDLYRDAPVPRLNRGLGGSIPTPAYEALGELVMSDERIVMTMKFPGTPAEGTPAPSFFEDTTQVGFADIPVDPGGTIRRALLYLWHGDRVYLSLSLQLALRYLHAGGITLGSDPANPELVKLGETTIPPFRSTDGAYAGADDGGYQFLLNYRMGAESPPSFSLGDVLAKRFDPEAIRDKVVILGSSAPSVNDYFYTPFSGSEGAAPWMHGLQIHAHAVSQLLRFARGIDKPVRMLDAGFEAAWVLLWSFLGASLALWSRSFWLSASLGAAALFGLVLLGTALFAVGWWIPVIPCALAGTTSAGLVATALTVIERGERRQVAGLFSRFLGDKVATEIWRRRDQFMIGNQPRAERATITAVMSDLEAFTSTSELLEPEELMGWVSDYMNAMSEEVALHQGVVEDYAGDGLKANFGFPVPAADAAEVATDAMRAVACAVAMGRRIDALNREWQRRGLPTGRCRVGVQTGLAVVGCIGSGDNLKYTAMGSTINTAARLQEFQKEVFKSEPVGSWRVLIGEETRNFLEDSFEVEDLGLQSLRGKSEKVRVFRVRGGAQSSSVPEEEGK